MTAVDVQVITYAPTAFYHCQHCEIAFGQVGLGSTIHREQAARALPEDLLNDFAALSERVGELKERYGDEVRVRIIDAASIEGFFKSLRYRTRTYPAVIVDGERREGGRDYGNLIPLVEGALTARKEVA